MIKKRFNQVLLLLVFIFIIVLTGTVSAVTYNCTDCTNCTNTIGNASAGDIVRLNESIADASATCIQFDGKDDITFDCLGNTIGGDVAFHMDYGIRLLNTNGGSNANNITNCNVTGFFYGIQLYSSDNNIITNSTFSGNSYGIHLNMGTDNSIFANITSNNNALNGLYLIQSKNNSFTNITIKENIQYDLYLSGIDVCQNNFSNIQGSGDRDIEFYNYTTTIEHKTVSQLVLCEADGSTINNVTIVGSDTLGNNALYSYKTDNLIISNINSSDNYDGIRLSDGDNNTLINITLNNNAYIGLYLERTHNNSITNLTANDNTQQGIYVYSSINNTFINGTANRNKDGIKFDFDSQNNTVSNFYLEGNSVYGIYFLDSGENKPEYNLLYNNVFNNTDNYHNSTVLTNYFNTTETVGTNIIGGPTIGGNYWTNSSGTGFSDTCTETNGDGICDSTYSLDGLNYDYLPLTNPVCVESWTYSAWSTCTTSTQTRTATDANSCGTTTDRLALSQTCTVEPGGGGGVTSGQPTESHSWTEIIPDEPAEMIITDPEIDLTTITITTTEIVLDASLTVTAIDVLPQADIEIGLVSGSSYQSFKIETTGITDENIEEAVIEFKVEKSWVEGEEGIAEDISLYRKQDKGNQWDVLSTTFVSEDENYYYFSATSPGFSIFVVVIDLSVCNNNDVCETENGEDESNCPNDCVSEKKGFFEMIKSYLWTGIIFVLVIAIGLVIMVLRGKESKRLKQMMEYKRKK